MAEATRTEETVVVEKIVLTLSIEEARFLVGCLYGDDAIAIKLRSALRRDGSPGAVITAVSPEPDRTKKYEDPEGDVWAYAIGGWHWLESSPDWRRYNWDEVVKNFDESFPWNEVPAI